MIGNTQLSVDEAELYDRQIRLWGIKSQEILRSSNVLLINVGGLGSEITKNILLSGINSLTLLDDSVVTPEKVASDFLLNQESIGEKVVEAVVAKAQGLNPLVKIKADASNVESKDSQFFAQFTIVVATQLNRQQIVKVSVACREHNVKFICGDNFGMFGFSIADFQEHTFYEERILKFTGKKRSRSHANTEPETKTIYNNFNYPSIEKVLAIPETPAKAKRRNVYFYLVQVLLLFREKFQRDPQASSKEKDIEELLALKQHVFQQYSTPLDKMDDNVFNLLFGEIVPICSVLGGVIAQEIIKAVSRKEVPICNVFLLDPFTFNGREERVDGETST